VRLFGAAAARFRSLSRERVEPLQIETTGYERPPCEFRFLAQRIRARGGILTILFSAGALRGCRDRLLGHF